MSYDSAPDAEHIKKFAERMRVQWLHQNTQDDLFLALEQRRSKVDVADSTGKLDIVKGVRTGIVGLLTDEDGALLTVTPFSHISPPTDDEDDKKHASELLEPFIASALKISQQTGRVFLRKPRTMRSLGRAWSFLSHHPRLWATAEFKAAQKEFKETADGDDDDAYKAAKKSYEGLKRDTWPIRWRYVESRNTWTDFTAEHWLPEVVELRKMSIDEIKDEFPNVKTEKRGTTKVDAYFWANWFHCAVVVNLDSPVLADSWEHKLGMNPYNLMEADLMGENELGIRWKPALYNAADLVETLDELLSDLRHNHRQNTRSPMFMQHEFGAYDQSELKAGRPPSLNIEPGKVYDIWSTEKYTKGDLPEINQQSIFLVQFVLNLIRENAIRPVERGEIKSGTSQNAFSTQLQIAQREFDPAMTAITDSWEYATKLLFRAITALGEKVYIFDQFKGKGVLGVGPEDVKGWENAVQARAAKAIPSDRQIQVATAAGMMDLGYPQSMGFETELGIENPDQVIRLGRREKIAQAVFEQVTVPAAIARATLKMTYLTPEQQQQMMEMFTGASPMLQQVLGGAGVEGLATVPAPGGMLQGQANLARTGVPQMNQMPQGGVI